MDLLAKINLLFTQKAAQFASSPVLNKAAETFTRGIQNIRQSDPRQYFLPTALNTPQTRASITTAGQALQRFPDTTIRPAKQPAYLKVAQYITNPRSYVAEKAMPFVSSLLGESVRDYGNTAVKIGQGDKLNVWDYANISDFIPGLGFIGVGGVKPIIREGGERLFREGGEQLLEKAVEKKAGKNLISYADNLVKSSAKERLSTLINYGQELYKRGYPKSEIEKMSFKDAEAILKGNIMPKNVLKFGKKAPEVQKPMEMFRNWVNTRRATNVEGVLQSREFVDLKTKGLKGILEFQSGAKAERFADLKNYFDTKYGLLNEHGIKFNYKQDYLPQLWNNTKEEIEKVLGKKLTTRPSFTIEALIKNYKEGIAGGLSPKVESLPDLVRFYEQATNKAVADFDFFKYLKNEGLIQMKHVAPKEWGVLDPERFPNFYLKTQTETYTDLYKAPPELAEAINNYLSNPMAGGKSERVLASIANYVSSAKNRMLSFGVPGTGINFHGFNILARSYLEGGPRGAIKTAWYMVNPNAAEKFVAENLTKAPDAIKSGLSFSTSEYSNAIDNPTLRSKFGEVWNKLFEKPLFEKIISAKKLEAWDTVWKNYAKSMPVDKAKKEASTFVNTVYGGINWEQFGRDRTLQNWFRVAALTPDWLESNLKLGKGMLTGMLSPRNPAGQAYRKAFTNLLGAYVGLNIINKLNSGHWMIENDPGHTFELEAGYTKDGQKRYYRPFGTAVDFIRLPVDIIQAALQGDFTVAAKTVRNRLSALVQPAVALLFNVNWKGQAVYGKDKYGNPIPAKQQIGGVLSELGTFAGFPSFIREGIDYATGKQGLEQALLQGFELPFRYSGGTYSTAQKQVQEIKQAEGKELYEQNKEIQGQSKFGKADIAGLEQGVISIQDIAQRRSDDAQVNKVKEIVSQTGVATSYGDKFIYYDKSDGVVHTISTNFEVTEPTLTGNSELDATLVKKYKSAISRKISDVGDLFEQGGINQGDAEKLITALKKQSASFSTTKIAGVKVSIKRPKKFSGIKSTKTIKYKLAKGKTFTIKSKAAPKIKGLKLKNLAVKIPAAKVPKLKIALKNPKSLKTGFSFT